MEGAGRKGIVSEGGVEGNGRGRKEEVARRGYVLVRVKGWKGGREGMFW